MSADRDELVKRTFPALRKLCEERGVIFTDVDLRWGITDEVAAEGNVLPICLAEIDTSRPYFIGILGERYGWVPEIIPEHLCEQMPWLDEHKSHSVTELEILHGVLNNPEMADRSYFYFRDKTYIDSIPVEKRNDFISEDSMCAGKLNDLKSRIRSSGLPVQEDYAGPEHLGHLVLEDFTRLINELFPQGSTPDPLTRERAAHESYSRARHGVYIGRKKYFDILDNAALSDEPPLVIIGQSGGGKSALLANWAAMFRTKYPDVRVVEHYTGASSEATDWSALCRRIVAEAGAAVGIEYSLPDQPDLLAQGCVETLHQIGAKTRIVLIIDGLNQIEDQDAALSLPWLPESPPHGLRIIISTLPGKSLEVVRRRGWLELEVLPLEFEERAQLIHDYLGQFAKKLEPRVAAEIAAKPQTANPLFLRVLLEELRIYGNRETFEDAVQHYSMSCDVIELYEKVLARWQNDYERECPNLVRDTMSAIRAARRGLSETELLEIIGGKNSPLPRGRFSPLFLAAEASLITRSGQITFGHDFVRQAVLRLYSPDSASIKADHLRLAKYFSCTDLCKSSRSLDEVPWHLQQAGEWDHLAKILSKPEVLELAWDSNKWDVRRYWASLRSNSVHRPESAYSGIADDEATSGKVLASVGTLLRDAGQASDAVTYLEHARDRMTDDSKFLGQVEVSLSDMRHIVGKYQEAAEEGNKIKERLGKLHGIDSRLYHDAVLRLAHYYKFFDLARAREELEMLSQQELAPPQRATLMFALGGSIMSLLGEVEKGTTTLNIALSLADDLGDLDLVGRCCRRLVDYELVKDEPDLIQSVKIWERGMSASKSVGSRQCIYLHCTRAEIFRRAGDFDSALKWHENGKKLAEEAGIRGWVAHANLGIAETNRLLRHESSTNAEAARLIYEEIGQSWGMLHAYLSVVLSEGTMGKSWSDLKELRQKAYKFGYAGDVDNITKLIEEKNTLWHHPLLFP